jgi:hypothetical protein
MQGVHGPWLVLLQEEEPGGGEVAPWAALSGGAKAGRRAARCAAEASL